MLADKFEQFFAADRILHKVYLHHIHVAEVVESVVWVIDVSHAATHSGCEVAPSLTKNHNTSACHVLAAMVACAFDDSNRSAVSHTKTFADLSVDV